jgi:hypothetical protein
MLFLLKITLSFEAPQDSQSSSATVISAKVKSVVVKKFVGTRTVRALWQENHVITQVTGHAPFGLASGLEHQFTLLAVGAVRDAPLGHRVRTGLVRALITAGSLKNINNHGKE